MSDNYSPIFTSKIPSDSSLRWGLIRQFLESWYDMEIKKTDYSKEVEMLESDLNIEFPTSLKSYILLSKQLLSMPYDYPGWYTSHNFDRCLRDIFEIKKLGSQEAVCFMIQFERDIHWAIDFEHLLLDDPPVKAYLPASSKPDNEEFRYDENVSDTLTGFILDHLIHMLKSKEGGNFWITVEDTPAIWKMLESTFSTHSRFDHIDIFEMENIITFVQKNKFGPDFDSLLIRVQVWKNIGEANIPEEILKLADKGTGLQGFFIERSIRKGR